VEETFKCDKCEKEPDYLWSFTQYGNCEKKKEDNGEYCEECFEQLEKLYSSQQKNS